MSKLEISNWMHKNGCLILKHAKAGCDSSPFQDSNADFCHESQWNENKTNDAWKTERGVGWGSEHARVLRMKSWKQLYDGSIHTVIIFHFQELFGRQTKESLTRKWYTSAPLPFSLVTDDWKDPAELFS